jgi:hypothetical protein
MKTLIRFYLTTLSLLAFTAMADPAFEPIAPDSTSATTTTACDNLTNGLIAYWRFEGNGHDSIGGNYPLGNHPLIGAGVPNDGYATGIIGRAMNQSGNPRSFQVQNGTNINLSQDFTISAWAYREQPIYDNDSIFDNGAIYIAKRDMAPWLSSMGVTFNLSQQGVALVDNSGMGEPPLHTWFHVIVFRKGNTAGIKVNNKGTATIPLTGLTLKSGPVVYLGQHKSGYPWQGRIDEFGIWSRALSASEMTALYNGGKGWLLRP